MTDQKPADQRPAEAMPMLRIKFEDAAGKQLAPPFEVKIPGQLSLRTAKMCLLELAGKALKSGTDEALKGMGFK
jgi:hypothetical protein